MHVTDSFIRILLKHRVGNQFLQKLLMSFFDGTPTSRFSKKIALSSNISNSKIHYDFRQKIKIIIDYYELLFLFQR